MNGYALLLASVSALGALGLYLFWGRLSHFPDRTVRDVPLFLRPVDSANMLKILNPEDEAILRSALTKRARHWEQLRTLPDAREYMMRRAHNASIFIEWANAELSHEIVGRPADTEDYLESARKLQLAASEFRIYAILSLIKINFWMIFRTVSWLPFSAPSLANLREVYGFQFFSLHSRLSNAVSELGLLYGNEFQHDLLKAL